jgi:alkylation response protein AidB-like acyl-CoA dehydrogenase
LTLEEAIEKDKFFDSNQNPNDVKVKRVFDVGGAACTYADIEFGADTIRGASAYILGKPNDGVDGIRQFVTLNNIQVALSASSCALSAYRSSLEYATDPIEYYPSLQTEDCYEDRVSDWEDGLRSVHAEGYDEKVRTRRHASMGLIDRPDVRRMLLAQKAFAEGGMALCIYCTLLDDIITHDHSGLNATTKRELESLLRLLSPITKAWVTEHSLQSVDMACRIFDGMGVVTDNVANNLLRSAIR